MKKSILTLFLALVVAMALCACGGETAQEPAETEETETAAETEEAAETEVPDEVVSRLAAVCDSMDPETGIHMNYDLYMASLDVTTTFDTQGKGNSYYERQTTVGLEDYDKIKLVLDGTYYTLQVRDMTGISVDIGDYTYDNPMMHDSIFSSMMACKDRTDFTVGQTELNGQTYASETFPEKADTGGEMTFCFNEDGSLAGCILVSTLEDEPMKTTINSIDSQVDESLFDVSGYTITGNAEAAE